jgi:hypothetical protein
MKDFSLHILKNRADPALGGVEAGAFMAAQEVIFFDRL